MTRPLAALDTSILIYLLTEQIDDSPKELEDERRRALAREWIRQMQAKYRWAIPSVVVAELGRDNTPQGALRRLEPIFSRFRILPLTYRASCIAAAIAARALRERPIGAERGAVKYDALICATAIANRAECLVTENRRDFARYVAEAGVQLDIVVPSDPPATGQLHMLHRPV